MYVYAQDINMGEGSKARGHNISKMPFGYLKGISEDFRKNFPGFDIFYYRLVC